MVEPTDWLGVDVGWVYPAVDSDGTIYRWAKADERHHTTITPAGPVKITRADGTTLTRDPYDAGQLADINARARRNDDRLVVIQITNRIISKARRTDRGIALEDWETFKGRRSAWIHVYNSILKHADQRGVPVRAVNRAWTSLTCPECGFIDRVNRPDRGTFLCGHCGHTGQADHVAATNLRLKALHRRQVHLDRAAHCANPACRSPNLFRSGLCLRCTFFKQRCGRYPTAEQIGRLQEAADLHAFIALNDLPRCGEQAERWGSVDRVVAKPRPKSGWVPAFARPDRPIDWDEIKRRALWLSQMCAICHQWEADDLDFSITDGDYRIDNLAPVCKKHRTPLPAIAWQIRNARTR